MDYQFYSADKVFPVSSKPIENGVIVIDDKNTIVEVLNVQQSASIEISNTKHFRGYLTPGFVNTHCHLELSHLYGKIPIGIGLAGFVKHLQQIRNVLVEEIEETAISWQNKMLQRGIVAIGDICNSNHSLKAKSKSILAYHNFIELFSFVPAKTKEKVAEGNLLKKQFDDLRTGITSHFKTSLTPHAPYSTSRELIRLLSQNAVKSNEPLTIHNQETAHENTMFKTGSGEMMKMIKDFGINTDFWSPSGSTSLRTLSECFAKNHLILVHNTFTTDTDILSINQFAKEVFWCLCPKANWYIENCLPPINLLNEHSKNICLGTDSLASNDDLSILSEMKLINSKFPDFDFETILQWATVNGAKALKFENLFGSFEKGKKPGINLLTEIKNEQITAITQVIKVV